MASTSSRIRWRGPGAGGAGCGGPIDAPSRHPHDEERGGERQRDGADDRSQAQAPEVDLRAVRHPDLHGEERDDEEQQLADDLGHSTPSLHSGTLSVVLRQPVAPRLDRDLHDLPAEIGHRHPDPEVHHVRPGRRAQQEPDAEDRQCASCDEPAAARTGARIGEVGQVADERVRDGVEHLGEQQRQRPARRARCRRAVAYTPEIRPSGPCMTPSTTVGRAKATSIPRRSGCAPPGAVAASRRRARVERCGMSWLLCSVAMPTGAPNLTRTPPSPAHDVEVATHCFD